jgi:hypothetical protein
MPDILKKQENAGMSQTDKLNYLEILGGFLYSNGTNFKFWNF